MSAQTPSKPEARLPTMKALDDLDGALPSYSELPYSDVLKARYCWGLFGEADEIGTMNLLTPRRVKAALGRVSEGLRVNLSLPLNEPSPAPPSRGSYVHHIHTGNLNSLDDYVDNFYLQGSSQWDALRHIRAREFGYYNGYREPEVGPDGRHLGIDRIAEHGIFCRGVLVDVAGYHARHGKPLDPTVGHPITVDDLKAVMDEENVSLEAGDLLVVRTGWLAALLAGDAAERERIMTTRGVARTSCRRGDGRVSLGLACGGNCVRQPRGRDGAGRS